jgi:hypothetical protein
MLDMYEISESDDTDGLARSVRHVLSQAYEEANRAAPDSRDEFAFNVLLNSLCSVLAAVRSEAPEAFGTYCQMVQLVAPDE